MRKLLRSLLDFCCGRESRSGNVAIIFSLAIIPVIGATGAALDYSMASSNRSSMQKALDATALALAKLMPLSQADLNKKGWQIFSTNLGTLRVRINAGDLVITQPSTKKLTLAATGQYDPFISGVIGVSSFPVAARAQVTWGLKKLEIALALDNTGSMDWSNKMTELKKAAKNLMTTLENAAKNPGDVKVAIIPFNTIVNVGTANVNANWIRWDLWENDNQTCKGKKNPKCTPDDHDKWTGCVEDRDKDVNKNYDALDTTPTGVIETQFPAIQCSGSLVSMMPLTYNWSALKNKIDSMEPAGNTNVTIGLTWAWHALTSSLPLTEAAAPAADLSKYIILMTDGENTQNRWTKTASQIDARTAAACANAKAAGLRIYTIRVIDGDENLLRNCATDPSMYFNVQSAGDLSAVFNAIGGQLASLHLSQ